MCALYFNTTMNKQWKVIINSLKNGEIIISNESPSCLLYYNPFAEQIADSIRHITKQKSSIEDLLASTFVRVIQAKSDSEQATTRRSFMEFVENYSESLYSNCDCFLDVPELLIEVKVNKVTLDNNEAKLVSLTDYTSARSLEKLKTESKYKTILISSISHELRTLDLVKEFISKDLVSVDSMKLLEMSKECCNMVTSHSHS
eukprot:TRINITY_DN1949_c0_g1_i13.p2 TRINITY_DN1949_c0_g1~~TRINITY_DN1949_c0_g1_i13.p2  ORF type:complete len:202 (+),score=56.63 TRINITY_DN1949_c0_g1_i13:833-1438(+)